MPRRLALLSFVLLLPFFVNAQLKDGVLLLKRDSLYRVISLPYWRFTPKDISNGADTAIDDSKWPLVYSDLEERTKYPATGFKGIGWLRLHLMVDSAVATQTLALRLGHDGASEIFLDGKLLQTNGTLTPKDSAEYVNPQQAPLALPTLSAGHHVLAVHYANWAYKRNQKRYNDQEPGLNLSFWNAADAVRVYNGQQSVLLFSFVLLFGIFITLSLVHLILYLYYRAEKANARFSFFAACVSLLLFIPAIVRVTDDAVFILRLWNAELCIVAAVGFSLSLMLNSLFSRRRWHFYIIAASCLALLGLAIFYRQAVVYAFLAVFILAPLEALYILIGAVWRRQPGARIVGGGLLLFIMLVLTVIAVILIEGDFSLSDNSTAGKLFLLTFILATLSIPVSMSMYLAWRFSRVSKDLKAQLGQVEALSARTREQEAEKQRILENRKEELEQEVAERTASLRDEKEKSDSLLRNILPDEVAEELKQTGRSEARLYSNVSVLFTDFVDFTQVAERLSPSGLVAEIDNCFQAFDNIIERHGLEKIKTVGDAYIAVSGMPAQNEFHAQSVITAALEIRDHMAALQEVNPSAFGIRLGVHSGPVVAGIVGVKKFAYDIWGDTVNTAARMEQHSEEGKVNISNATYELVKGNFLCSYRGELEAKHKGRMGMYFVESALVEA